MHHCTEGNLNGKRQQWGKFSLGMFRRPRHGCLISTWPVPCAQSTCNLPDHGTRALTQQCNVHGGFEVFTKRQHQNLWSYQRANTVHHRQEHAMLDHRLKKARTF